MKEVTGSLRGLISKKHFFGPWECSRCHQLTQYADVKKRINRIFCRNPLCGYCRIVDKVNHRIIEDDGTHWLFDDDGKKTQVRAV